MSFLIKFHAYTKKKNCFLIMYCYNVDVLCITCMIKRMSFFYIGCRVIFNLVGGGFQNHNNCERFHPFLIYRLTSSADSAMKKPWVAFSIFILLPGLIARVLSLPSSCLTSIANSNSFSLEKHNLLKSFLKLLTPQLQKSLKNKGMSIHPLILSSALKCLILLW